MVVFAAKRFGGGRIYVLSICTNAFTIVLGRVIPLPGGSF